MRNKKIESQKMMQEFLQSIYWGHVFIREIYAVSRSYKRLDGEGTINPDIPIDLHILILTDDKEHPGVELFFEETEQMEISFTTNLELQGIVKKRQLRTYKY